MKNKFTTSEIGDIAGISRKTVWKYFTEHHIQPIDRKGNTAYYSVTAKDQVVTAYKPTDNKPKHQSPLEIKDEELRNLDAKYKAIIDSKNETISSLKKEIETLNQRYEKLDNQLAVKDQQIATVSSLADKADRLVDQAHALSLEHADKSNETPSSAYKVINSSDENTEKPHQNWLQRLFHFGK